jgi:hypothetical protein
MRRAPAGVFILLLVLLRAFGSQAATETERLVALARIWGAVKLGHPYLLYKDVD